MRRAVGIDWIPSTISDIKISYYDENIVMNRPSRYLTSHNG